MNLRKIIDKENDMTLEEVKASLGKEALEVLGLIEQYGGVDGGHHKQWVLDQIVRALLKEHYSKWVAECEDGEDGPRTYEWDTGVAP